MLVNYHTHTTFCDGKDEPEAIVAYAIENGIDGVGFSAHGYTSYDYSYCLRDLEGYIAEINRLKEKYAGKIAVWLGVEEDSRSLMPRERFDYIIGSCHYITVDGKSYPIDSSPEQFKRCLELFKGDALQLADAYYRHFCEYILTRKPDIVGHFDLITKFDELDGEDRFLHDEKYLSLAERYLADVAGSGCAFEVNTGAICRGYRTTPYPHERLLYALKKAGGKVTISSDSHAKETLCFGFEEAKKLLKEVGFSTVCVLTKDGWKDLEI